MTALPQRHALDAAEPVPRTPPPALPPAIALAELAAVLWRRKGTALAVAALTLAAAGLTLTRFEPRYAATAEVLLESRAPRVVEVVEVMPGLALDAQAVQSELRLIQSQQLIARVVAKLRLTEDPEFGVAAREGPPGRLAALKQTAQDWLADTLGWAPPPAFRDPARDARRARLEAISALRKRLTVTQQDLSRVIAIRMESADPDKAALIANAIADQYIVDQLEAKFDATRRASDWLTRRLDEISARLAAAETAAEAQRARSAADLAGGPETTRLRMADLAAALEALGPDDHARRAALQASLADLRRLAAAQSESDIELRQLEREAEAIRQLHDAFLARLKETDAQAGLQRPDARLIAAAAPPLNPAFPNVRLILGFALMGGLALGAAAAFLRESLGGVWHAPEAAEADTGLRVLAALPLARGWRPDPVRDVRRRPGSRLGEAVRDLRSALLSGLAGEQGAARVIAVISPGPGEGKSTLAALLAESCARMGRRVALVDCDIRNPAQARRYGLSGEEDLIAVLAGETPFETALFHDAATGVTVLPAQPAPASRSDLLAGPEFTALIARLSSRFDAVILDSPPALAVADARLIAARADAAVLALRWGETTREEARQALRALGETGGRVAGLALIGVSGRADPRINYGGGGGRYGRFSEYFSD